MNRLNDWGDGDPLVVYGGRAVHRAAGAVRDDGFYSLGWMVCGMTASTGERRGPRPPNGEPACKKCWPDGNYEERD